MKKILQAFDGASTKPVEGASDMSKFLSIVDKNNVSIIREEINNNQALNEGANPHKVSLPVQMAMQHYQEPVVKAPRTIKEVKKNAMSSLLYQYYTEAQVEVETEDLAKKEIISEQARQIASRILAKENRLDELSKETLKSYKSKAEDQVKELEPHALDGEYKDLAKNAIERRKKGIEKAEKKIATKESQDPAEYDQEGDMARQDLTTAEEAAEELRSILSSNENLPEWVQAKITKAVDYLDTARDYMKSKEFSESRYHSYHDELQHRERDEYRNMSRGRGEIDDESNLMYIYKDGRLKQAMIDNRDERRAHAQGFRGSQESALKLHGIIRSKFKPGKWVQKQGTQWIEVHPFGQPEDKI